MQQPEESITPSSSRTHTLTWSNEAATQAAAQTLAGSNHLNNAILLLHGDLGAGKTTFVRYVLRALGIQTHVKSPTYAFVESYEAPAFEIWHFDFYRFNDPFEWEDAGFRDIFSSPGLKLVEWPEQAGDLLPQADLELTLKRLESEERQVTFQANTRLGQAILQHLNQPPLS